MHVLHPLLIAFLVPVSLVAGLTPGSELPQPVAHLTETSSARAPLSCELEITVLDSEGEIFEGPIDLWRLDVPADELYSAGDQRVAKRTLEAGEVRFEGLEPGRYRLEVWRRAARSEALPIFEVALATETKTFQTQRARTGELRCVFYDLNVEPWEHALQLRSADCTYSNEDEGAGVPSWAQPRKLHVPSGYGRHRGGVACSMSLLRELVFENGAHVIGPWTEPTIDQSLPPSLTFSFERPLLEADQERELVLRWQGEGVARALEGTVGGRAAANRAADNRVEAFARQVRIPKSFDLGPGFAFQSFAFETSALRRAVVQALALQFSEAPSFALEAPLFASEVARNDLYIEIELRPREGEPYTVHWYPARGPLSDVDLARPQE